MTTSHPRVDTPRLGSADQKAARSEQRRRRRVTVALEAAALADLDQSLKGTGRARRQAVASAAGPPEQMVGLTKSLDTLLRRAASVDPGEPVALIHGLVTVSDIDDPGTPLANSWGPGLAIVTESYLLHFPYQGVRTYSLAGAVIERERPATDGPKATTVRLSDAAGGKVLRVSMAREKAEGEAARLATALAYVVVHRHATISVDHHNPSSRPALRLIRTPRDAEEVAATWMTYLGYGEARLTSAGADGGIDVDAARGVAQVKMEAVPTGRPAIQQLLGAAAMESKDPVFFSLAGYTPEAVEWADRGEMPLFRFDFQGEPSPKNPAAEKRFAWAAASNSTAGGPLD